MRLLLDCRFLPHGLYSLLPAVLSTMAFWTAVVQDGCDYARLKGGNVERIAGSDVLPYLEVGILHYRPPNYYAGENEWKLMFTEHCQDYPSSAVDTFQRAAKWLLFASAVIGGAVSSFLWFVACCSFSIRTWRLCAIEALLAGSLRCGSFLFLISSVCRGNETQCSLSFGSRMDIIGISLWIATTLSLLGHYAEPKLRRITPPESDRTLDALVEEDEHLAPRRLSSYGRSASHIAREQGKVSYEPEPATNYSDYEQEYDGGYYSSRSRSFYRAQHDEQGTYV